MIANLLTLTLLAAPLPDALDHLKAVDVVPNIGLLLDASCSMADNPKIPTSCSWFAANYTSNNLSMTKNQVMRAALVGCQNSSDGILDKWVSRVNFSIFDFGRSSTDATLRAPFGSTLATLEAAAVAVPATGSTPITTALRAHGRYFNTYFTNTNTLQCRPNFILLLTDGDPNGGGATFDFNCPVSGDPRQNLAVSATQPWLGADYMTRHRDMLCSVTGEQKIRTYTLGFGATGSFNPTNLQNIANYGLGQAFFATNLAQLDNSLSQMMREMVSRSAVFTAAPSIERDGLYNGNFFYAPAFRTERSGRWAGTVKKHCVEPARARSGVYDTTDRRCIFASDDGRTLVTNPAAQDLWTGTTTTAADRGGAGLLLLSRLGAAGGPPSTPYYPRRIQTWRPGTSAYVDVTASTWAAADSYMSGLDHNRLLNLIHGYDFDATSTGNPTVVSAWPYGDTVHMPTALLRYGTNCQVAGSCFLLVGANDGQLHVHDTANGAERSALIPAELWRATGIANDQLRAMDDQPATDSTHRYYLDGGLSVFHDDANGDGVIQSSETAYLVFGLGRGGSAYYQIPVSRFDGVFDATRNPVRALTGVAGSATAELGDTWATPWLGAPRWGTTRRRLAILPTGHQRKFDVATQLMPATVDSRPRLGSAVSQTCAAAVTGYGMVSSFCGNYSATAYYSDSVAADVTMGPLAITNVSAYRLTFSAVNLDPNDRLLLLDSKGQTVATYTGALTGAQVSPWVYGDRFSLRWITNGTATNHRGYTISTIETQQLVASTASTHTPGVYVLDLDRWNGSSAINFASSSQIGSTVMEIASVCRTSPTICVNAAANPDLNYMVCPISTEVSVLTAGDRIDALYWGDECGQLWKAWSTDRAQTVWRAKRLLKLNGVDPSYTTPYQSKDYRKVFRRLDLVPSSCPGQRVTGVYFGSGNVQRPTATDELANTSLAASGRDVVGVVWDSSDLPANATLTHLRDVTAALATDPRATGTNRRYGWYWSLSANERMLRDPLVFDGIAYFKSFRPVSAAYECTNSTGVDTVYAVDNCTAEPVIEGPTAGFQIADRAAWTGNTDVGGNLMLITTKTGQPLVTVANLSRSEAAQVVPDDHTRVPRIYHWREPRRE